MVGAYREGDTYIPTMVGRHIGRDTYIPTMVPGHTGRYTTGCTRLSPRVYHRVY